MKRFIIICLSILFLTSCACSNKQNKYIVDEDDIIHAMLLETYGTRLDATYNLSNKEYEKGNWILDVGSEMDWEDLIPLIIAMPDFGSDSDYEELRKITNDRVFRTFIIK